MGKIFCSLLLLLLGGLIPSLNIASTFPPPSWDFRLALNGKLRWEQRQQNKLVLHCSDSKLNFYLASFFPLAAWAEGEEAAKKGRETLLGVERALAKAHRLELKFCIKLTLTKSQTRTLSNFRLFNRLNLFHSRQVNLHFVHETELKTKNSSTKKWCYNWEI